MHLAHKLFIVSELVVLEETALTVLFAVVLFSSIALTTIAPSVPIISTPKRIAIIFFFILHLLAIFYFYNSKETIIFPFNLYSFFRPSPLFLFFFGTVPYISIDNAVLTLNFSLILTFTFAYIQCRVRTLHSM